MILQTRTSSELVFVPHSIHNNSFQITTKSKATVSYMIMIVNLHLNYTGETENL